MAFTLTNNAEGGTAGAAVTTISSGGASGNGFNVAQGSGTTFVTGADAILGSMSYRVQQSATTAEQAKLMWSDALGTISSGTTIYTRAYRRIAALPSAPILMQQFRDSAGGVASLRLRTDGRVELINSAGSVRYTSASAIPSGVVIREEVSVLVHATDGRMLAKFWWDDGTSGHGSDAPAGSESLVLGSTSAAEATRGSMSELSFGIATSSTGNAHYLDGLAATDQGWLGPLGAAAVPEWRVLVGGSWVPGLNVRALVGGVWT